MNLLRRAHLLLAALLGLAAATPAAAVSYTFRSDTYAWESSTTTLVWDRLCT